MISDKVVHGTVNSQWQTLLAWIATVVRASEPAGAPAIVAYDAADNESYIIVDCGAFVKGRQLDKRIVVRVVWMAHNKRRNAAFVAKRRSMARFDGGHGCRNLRC